MNRRAGTKPALSNKGTTRNDHSVVFSAEQRDRTGEALTRASMPTSRLRHTLRSEGTDWLIVEVSSTLSLRSSSWVDPLSRRCEESLTFHSLPPFYLLFQLPTPFAEASPASVASPLRLSSTSSSQVSTTTSARSSYPPKPTNAVAPAQRSAPWRRIRNMPSALGGSGSGEDEQAHRWVLLRQLG